MSIALIVLAVVIGVVFVVALITRFLWKRFALSMAGRLVKQLFKPEDDVLTDNDDQTSQHINNYLPEGYHSVSRLVTRPPEAVDFDAAYEQYQQISAVPKPPQDAPIESDPVPYVEPPDAPERPNLEPSTPQSTSSGSLFDDTINPLVEEHTTQYRTCRNNKLIR